MIEPKIKRTKKISPHEKLLFEDFVLADEDATLYLSGNAPQYECSLVTTVVLSILSSMFILTFR